MRECPQERRDGALTNCSSKLVFGDNFSGDRDATSVLMTVNKTVNKRAVQGRSRSLVQRCRIGSCVPPLIAYFGDEVEHERIEEVLARKAFTAREMVVGGGAELDCGVPVMG